MWATKCTYLGCDVIEIIGGTLAIASIFANHHEISRVTGEASCSKSIPATSTGYIAKWTVHGLVGVVITCIACTFGAG